MEYRTLTRDEVLDSLESLALDPEFAPWRDSHLDYAVNALDLTLATAMLDLGASPDPPGRWSESFLHDLFHQYVLVRTTAGDRVLAMVRLLLARGANPNRVGCNNFRAMDLAMEYGCIEFANLLLAAGADPQPRPFI